MTGDLVCPICASAAGPSGALVAAYEAECGTTFGDRIEPRQSPACRIISALRVELALHQMGVAS